MLRQRSLSTEFMAPCLARESRGDAVSRKQFGTLACINDTVPIWPSLFSHQIRGARDARDAVDSAHRRAEQCLLWIYWIWSY